MSLIESMVYGIVSGLAEFLPVSARAHQAVLRYLFGVDTRNYLQEFLVHIGVLAAILYGCRDILFRLQREQRSQKRTVRKRRHMFDAKSYYELRLLRTAAAPIVVGLLLTFVTERLEQKLLYIMVFLLINGAVLLLADHSSHGNRDSRTMSGLDGIVMGLLGALSAFPGISRTGIVSAYAALRGADSQNMTNWAILLGIPAMLFVAFFDFIRLFIYGFGIASFGEFISCTFSGIAAFGGGYLGISLLKATLSQFGFSKFAYYCLGAGLFTFILFLIT